MTWHAPAAPVADPTTTPGQEQDDLEGLVRRAFRVPVVALVGALALLLVTLVVGTTQGAAGIPVLGVVQELLGALPLVTTDSGLSSSQEAVLWSIRLPRVALGMLVGAALGMAGAGFQGVFRNPLADPYLLGVSAGAGFGAVVALGFGLDLGWGPVTAVPAAAFLGAVAAVAASTAVVRGSFADPASLLLSGVAMAALFSALQTYVLQRLDETRSREVLSWLFGKLATAGWEPVLLLLPYVVISGAVLVLHGRHLDVLRLGDDEARALGLRPERSRLVVILAATLVTAAAVSVSGLIAFVGLVVPHVVRLVAHTSYRVVVPLSAICGGAFLALVDVGARTLIAPAELPVGVLTAFVGAPFFAFVLARSRRHGW